MVDAGLCWDTATAIRRALIDDVLVDSAVRVNSAMVDERLDLNKIKPKVIELYRRVAESRGSSPTVREGSH